MSESQQGNRSPDNLVFPFMAPQINTNAYIKVLNPALGKVLKGSEVNKLAEAFDGGTDQMYSIQNLGSSARHLNFGFIIITRYHKTLIEKSRNLTIDSAQTVTNGVIILIVTSNLIDWRDNIVELSHLSELRSLTTQLHKLFCDLGYARMFDNYSKTQTPIGIKMVKR